MKKTTSFLLILIALTVLSFKGFSPSEKTTVLTGTYGICDCDSSKPNALKVELTINDDHTFQYYDNSDRNKIIQVNGIWEMKNKTIHLKNYQPGFSIHTKWSISKNEKCLKSRMGMEFTRLCNIKACK